MAFQIFDYRNDDHIKNLLVTPHIRSRFLRMDPGTVAGMHSHDLGHEIFLILQGSCIFYIEGDERELCAGQLCVALADEIHQVRVTSDEPMIMYLSVTPHIQPTHTGRDLDGTRHPTQFQPSSAYDAETDTQTPIDALVDNLVISADALAQAARYNAATQKAKSDQLKAALTAGDEDKASALREEMWQGVYQSLKQAYAMADIWNDLTPRAGKVG
jgi:quercetin dioxygenase-like cupin family protein